MEKVEDRKKRKEKKFLLFVALMEKVEDRKKTHLKVEPSEIEARTALTAVPCQQLSAL
jgi:hypothetical protein